MFEKWRIKEHMEVTDSNGKHLGTVDSVDGDRIKLTRSDSSDGAHHYLDMDQVDRIEDNRAYLKAGAPAPVAADRTQAQMMAGSGENFDGSAGAANPPGTEGALFGTSGHGTGMGGSGTN